MPSLLCTRGKMFFFFSYRYSYVRKSDTKTRRWFVQDREQRRGIVLHIYVGLTQAIDKMENRFASMVPPWGERTNKRGEKTTSQIGGTASIGGEDLLSFFLSLSLSLSLSLTHFARAISLVLLAINPRREGKALFFRSFYPRV